MTDKKMTNHLTGHENEGQKYSLNRHDIKMQSADFKKKNVSKMLHNISSSSSVEISRV